MEMYNMGSCGSEMLAWPMHASMHACGKGSTSESCMRMNSWSAACWCASGPPGEGCWCKGQRSGLEN